SPTPSCPRRCVTRLSTGSLASRTAGVARVARGEVIAMPQHTHPFATTHLTPSLATVAIISFEGPDAYSHCGVAGARASNIAESLAELGFDTHHFFIGDPRLPGVETRNGGHLMLHRWAQWVSAFHNAGVYDGEDDKMRELTASLPSHLVEHFL